MRHKSITKKSKNRKLNSKTQFPRTLSSTIVKMRYKFWVLMGVLVLAGIAIAMRIETPVVWTFLYGIGGWAAFTTNPSSNFH